MESEIERLTDELKVSEEKARLANEKAEAELNALHSEVKRMQWQKLMKSKGTWATTILEDATPDAATAPSPRPDEAARETITI